MDLPFTYKQARNLREFSLLEERFFSLGGLPVGWLTGKQFHTLWSAGNRWICGGALTVEMDLHFAYVASNSKQEETRFARSFTPAEVVGLKDEIDEYLQANLMDLRPGKTGPDRSAEQPWAGIVELLHLPMHYYGWTVEYTLSRPMIQLMQFRQRIIRDLHPSELIIDPYKVAELD